MQLEAISDHVGLNHSPVFVCFFRFCRCHEAIAGRVEKPRITKFGQCHPFVRNTSFGRTAVGLVKTTFREKDLILRTYLHNYSSKTRLQYTDVRSRQGRSGPSVAGVRAPWGAIRPGAVAGGGRGLPCPRLPVATPTKTPQSPLLLAPSAPLVHLGPTGLMPVLEPSY